MGFKGGASRGAWFPVQFQWQRSSDFAEYPILYGALWRLMELVFTSQVS